MREIIKGSNSRNNKYTHAELRSLQTKLDSLTSELALWKIKEKTCADQIASNQRWIRNIQCYKCYDQLGVGSLTDIANDFQPVTVPKTSTEGENNPLEMMITAAFPDLVDKFQRIYELETQIIKYALIKAIINDRETLLHRKIQVEGLQNNLKDICVKLVDFEIEKKKASTETYSEDRRIREKLLMEKQAIIIEKEALLNQVREDFSTSSAVVQKELIRGSPE